MEQASFEQLCPAESWKRVCGQGWGSNSLGFSASGLQLNWTAQVTSNPLIPRALRMPGDVTAASKDGSRICGDGAGLSSLPHRELFYSVCLVIRLRKHDWIKHWFLDVLHIRRLTKPFFLYAAGLRSDYWSTTGTGNSPLGSFVAEEWLENKAPH